MATLSSPSPPPSPPLLSRPPAELRSQRFGKNELLLGLAHVTALSKTRVLLVGLGGVGSWAAEALARAGIQHLCLVDCGKVKLSNCSQQLCALDSTIGRYKAEVTAARLRDIHPGAPILGLNWQISSDAKADLTKLEQECIKLWGEGEATDAQEGATKAATGAATTTKTRSSKGENKVDPASTPSFSDVVTEALYPLPTTEGQKEEKIDDMTKVSAHRFPFSSPRPFFDAVVDCCDDITSKAALAAAAVRTGTRTVVLTAGAATRLDPALMRAGDISETNVCPVAKKLRSLLRGHGVVQGVRVIFSTEPPRNRFMTSKDDLVDQFKGKKEHPQEGINISSSAAAAESEEATAEEEESPDRRRWQPSPMGSWVVVPAMFGLLAAHEVVMSVEQRPPPPDGFAAAYYEAEKSSSTTGGPRGKGLIT